MKLLAAILNESKAVDTQFRKLQDADVEKVKILYTVPSFHPRAERLKNYPLQCLPLDAVFRMPLVAHTKRRLVLINRTPSVFDFIQHILRREKIKPIILQAQEDIVKTKPFMEKLASEREIRTFKEDDIVIVIGGGLLLNIGAFIAEQRSCNLFLAPTTVLSMADGAGGKVRLNLISHGRAYKHYYKSFYEPNGIFIDRRFLGHLPELQKRIGLVEIIKHGLFQSPSLYHFLRTKGLQLFKDNTALLKSILWAAELKRVCLDIDVEENENGSRSILRGGHDFSDRLEEDQGLRIPHGFSVSIGIMRQLSQEDNSGLLRKAKEIFTLLGIPKTVEEYERLGDSVKL